MDGKKRGVGGGGEMEGRSKEKGKEGVRVTD